MISINCVYNEEGAWCTNKNIKRSLFGLGARCCVLFPYWDGNCEHQKKFKRPNIMPPPPPPLPKKKIYVEVTIK